MRRIITDFNASELLKKYLQMNALRNKKSEKKINKKNFSQFYDLCKHTAARHNITAAKIKDSPQIVSTQTLLCVHQAIFLPCHRFVSPSCEFSKDMKIHKSSFCVNFFSTFQALNFLKFAHDDKTMNFRTIYFHLRK